ncbi:MAG: DUF3604 domain-containing protein [Woeseiaceae bacterium]|mgnify:FL=1|nr:DUF3604 domain-containing protein [Woeseiaceae bacterium]
MNKMLREMNTKPPLVSLIIAAALFGLMSCSDTKMAPSSEAFSTAADVHSNEEIIASTAEIDALLDSNPLGWNEKVFETETELLVRNSTQPEAIASLPETTAEEILIERKPYYGDLHVHTTYSFDGYSMGTTATPYDAYRFARGEPIKNPAGYDMQLSRPMDFYAVTDHAMFLGLTKAAAETSTEFSKNAFSEPYHDLNAPENFGTGLFSTLKRVSTFADFLPRAVEQTLSGELDRDQVLGVIRSAWEDTVDAADQFNDPGNFTTFAAYEYTSSTAGMGNLHRNVIFEGTENLPREPFSRFHSVNPEDLWQWMDDLREKGVESLAIPHNSNGSNGQMFKLVDWAGSNFDDDYAQQRIRNEPIVEITQIKGTSETHPILSSRDEWAGFEIMPYRVATGALSQVEGSYVREALLNGMALEQQNITNPYQFGFIGSSDTHSAASQNDESNFSSKLGLLSSNAEQRGSIPRAGLSGELTYYGMQAALALAPNPMGKNMNIRINGDIYAGGGSPTFGASGLAAAWAEENTRASLYSAFRRKEVFATSGPRIALRFLAGYGFDEDMLTTADGVQRAYANGVSMGGNLSAVTSSQDGTAAEYDTPSFLIMAASDPDAAPLQRLQIIKGWIDADGNTHEDVIDVACAGNTDVNPETNRCADNGARVDISDCSINPETGAAELSALWHDPDFDPQQRAFYYARALENPTCRWSTWDAIRAGVSPRPDLATTIQERAWSSPIHYLAQ